MQGKLKVLYIFTKSDLEACKDFNKSNFQGTGQSKAQTHTHVTAFFFPFL